MVLCCLCGQELSGPAVGGARCTLCLQKDVDITVGISKTFQVEHCNTCNKFMRPPYIHCELESRELLSICLRKIRGMSREIQLVDAGFIYTEPHSKELKVKLVLRSEISGGAVVEQTMVADGRIENLQCPDCRKSFTRHTWDSVVQVRQRVDHRRTLLHMEQLILAHKAHQDVIEVAQVKEGLDFRFYRDHDAQAFATFFKTWAVSRHQESKHLISHNVNNCTYRYKRATCVEICPVCRDDLVSLPKKIAKAMGGLPPFMLCTRASSVLWLVDPASLRFVEVSASEYWKRPFVSVASQDQLQEFVVLDVDVEVNDTRTNQAHICKARIRGCNMEIARAADFGRNDERLLVKSHLGGFVQPGDIVLGYDISTLTAGFDETEGSEAPLEVYLVRKQRAERKSRVHGGKTSTSATAHLGSSDTVGDPIDSEEDDDQKDLGTAAAQLLDGFNAEAGQGQVNDSAAEVRTITVDEPEISEVDKIEENAAQKGPKDRQRRRQKTSPKTSPQDKQEQSNVDGGEHAAGGR